MYYDTIPDTMPLHFKYSPLSKHSHIMYGSTHNYFHIVHIFKEAASSIEKNVLYVTQSFLAYGAVSV